jgi:DNA topoisomerase-3
VRLIIAEKPSVARSIAAVIGDGKKRDGYIECEEHLISWCAGHLLELAPPDAYDPKFKKWRFSDLPIIPDKWKYVPSKGKEKQLRILIDLMNRSDVNDVINAADAGREGENIFRVLYEYAKCTKKVFRLWTVSLEESAIRFALENLIDSSEFDNLYAAASCRERGDWIVGINVTRAMTCLYGGTVLNAGRVQSPTLAMITKRDEDILSFVKKPFYTVELKCEGFTANSERFDDRGSAEEVMNTCGHATVSLIKQSEKYIAPPKLYCLTSLQREANSLHGYTAQQTLEYAQSLYEYGYISYPRTDCRYLTDDVAASMIDIVSATSTGSPSEFLQVVDAKRITDHHAIVPTAKGVSADLNSLHVGEREVYRMIFDRLICAVGDKHRYLETTVILKAGGTEFKAKGKTVIHDGWKSIANSQNEDNEGEPLPHITDIANIAEGQTIPVKATIKEGSTTPPKNFTEGTLLSSMETAGMKDVSDDIEKRGIGTPATRAGIIEKLIKTGSIERSKKNLLATDKGKNMIAVLPEALASPILTSDWEQKLKAVENGELSQDEFMDGIAAFITSVIKENNTPNPELIGLFGNANVSEPIGTCPRCCSFIRESTKGFFCDMRSCEFKLWKDSKFWTVKKRSLTAEIVTTLLKHGRIALKDLHSAKTGKKYDATVILEDSGNGYVNYGLEFSKR